MIINVEERRMSDEEILEVVQSYFDNYTMTIKAQKVNHNYEIEDWVKINVTPRCDGADPSEYSSILSSVEDSVKLNHDINVLLIPNIWD